jgi:hypothetical protein
VTRLAVRGACGSLTCWLAGRDERICALIRARKVGPCPRTYGEDRAGSDGGADCVLLPSGSRDIGYTGSAHDDAALEVLTAAARQRLVAGQDELDLMRSCARSRTTTRRRR